MLDRRQLEAGEDRPIRVVFYQFFPGGGIGKYTHEVLQRMHARPDVDCSLVCSPDYEWQAEADYPAFPILRSLRHARPLRRRARFLAAQYVNPRRLIVACARHHPDIVHFSNINHLTFPAWSAPLRRLGVAVAATAHDVRRATAMVNRRYEEAQLRAFYRSADRLFVHGPSQQQDLCDFADVTPSNITIVPHGPYTHGPAERSKREVRQRLEIPDTALVGLCFGQVRDDKNIDLLLCAAAAGSDRLYLIIAGRGGARGHRPIGAYRRMAAQLGIADRVRFLDRFIPDTEVADLYVASDWASLYYRRTFTSQSGVLSTCVHYRCPVIASGSGTLGETTRQYDVGVAAEPDDVATLASAIAAMERRLAAGDRFDFDRYIQENSWEENVRRTVAAYREVVARSRTTPR